MVDRELVITKLHYDPITGVFTWKMGNGKAPIGSIAGHKSGWGYVRISLGNKKYSAHQLAWLIVYGEWPDKQIDHIDGDKENNAIENLRLVTASINQLCNNKPRSNNKTGLVGVSPDRHRFKAQIKIAGKPVYLGSFNTKELAHAAYMAERAKHLAAHGITKSKQ